MYTKQALRELGVTASTLTRAQLEQFDDLGFLIIERVLSPEDCEKMRNEFERIHAIEKDNGGHEVHVEPGARRISNIFNKSEVFDKCLWIPEILAATAHALGEIKVHGANMRDPVMGFGHQDLHADVPKRFADDWWVVNSMIMFDDMTLNNGPTRIVPKSHYWTPINVPYVNIGDWNPAPLTPEEESHIPESLSASYPGEVLVEAPAGSAIICNSSMWHAGTLKHTDQSRRMMHLTYTRRDLPQQLLQLDYLTSALYDRMTPVKRYLLEIEPKKDSNGILRQPAKVYKGWWN